MDHRGVGGGSPGRKFAGAALGALLARLDLPLTIAAGLMAKGVAEIAILLVLLEHDIIGQAVFSLFVLIMLAYILFAPPIIGAAVSRAKPSGQSLPVEDLPPSLVRFVLDNITVGHLIDREHSYPGPEMSVRDFAEQWIVPHQQDYVVAEKGKLVGIVSLAMLRYLPRHAWSGTPLAKIVRQTTPNTWPDEAVEDALQRMTEHSLTVIPVKGSGVGRVRGGRHQPGDPGADHGAGKGRAVGGQRKLLCLSE